MREDIKPEIKQSCFDFAKSPIVAGGVTWKNASSHSRDDLERVPNVFTTEIGGCRITIVIGHIDWPNTWIMNCHELGIVQKSLLCSTAIAAAQLAVLHCKEKVQKLHDAFSSCV
jgi:hypothetical protein